jgi:hypothetical protein
VVHAFLDCGDLAHGFARVVCPSCHRELLVAFSCARRGFCPSCAAKRGAIFGAFVAEEILEPVGHSLWTFTMPKLLRPYFLHRRELIGRLCSAAWETVSELAQEASGKGVAVGMVAAVHTAASDLAWHPHVHALASRGGWDRDGRWYPVPYIDTRAAELVFRAKVLRLLTREGLLDEGRIALLDAWKSGHTGFSAHNAVHVSGDDRPGVERLARYLLRPPLALERLRLEPGLARYRHKRSIRRNGEPYDPADLLARLLMHIPAPRLHLVRYYGHYSHVARARRRAQANEDPPATRYALDPDHRADPTSRAERRRLRRQWAKLIRHIYEVDPLRCPCGAEMRIVAFLTEPRVVRKILDHLDRAGAGRSREPPRGDAEPQALAS